jgi:hypothetical protein
MYDRGSGLKPGIATTATQGVLISGCMASITFTHARGLAHEGARSPLGTSTKGN